MIHHTAIMATGINHQEIADQLDLSVANTRVIPHRRRAALQKILEENRVLSLGDDAITAEGVAEGTAEGIRKGSAKGVIANGGIAVVSAPGAGLRLLAIRRLNRQAYPVGQSQLLPYTRVDREFA